MTDSADATSAVETSTAMKPHDFLRSLEGEWTGTAKTYFEPGVLGDESQWRGTIRPILGGLYMLHEYEGAFDRTRHLGRAVIGYSAFYERYEMAWVDTHHNGPAIMFCTGTPKETHCSVAGTYPAGDGSPDWGWRTTFEKPDDDTVVITAYNITPAGEEAVAIETVYRRVEAEAAPADAPAAPSADAAAPTASTEMTPHRFLRSLVGDWRGTARTWFEPEVLGDESEWSGTIRTVLNDLFIVHEYTGTICGQALAGMALIGYNPYYDRFQMAWVDNNHSANAMMFAAGGGKAEMKPAMLGSCPGYPGEPDWGWRTELETPDAETLVITAYNISPAGDEAKAIETIYRRVEGESR